MRGTDHAVPAGPGVPGGPGAALVTVADALRAGASPEQAWGRVGVLVRDGLPIASTVRAVTGDETITAAVLAAARLAEVLGTSAAPTLDAVWRTMEEEADAAVRRATALAGPAASARVLAWLPALGLALGVALGVNPIAVLLDPRGGWLLLAGGLAASAVGRWWSGRLLRRATAVASTDERDDEPTARPRGGPAGPGGRLQGLVEPPPGEAVAIPVAVVLDLVAAACESGASVPRTLGGVGAAVGGRRGAGLAEAGSRLVGGAPWAMAWAALPPGLSPVAEALRPAWEDGASPVAAVRAAARARRRAHHARALAAAERLGVQLLLPLALCHLPAFVVLGIVPVLVSFLAQPATG